MAVDAEAARRDCSSPPKADRDWLDAMNLSAVLARDRFAAARHAYLATVSADGQPHLVPVTFALTASDAVVIAIDHKPKRGTDLRRLRNIAANPRVSLLADEYRDEDWTRLWWVRADGDARILTDPDRLVAELVGKYPQYRERPPAGPVIHIDVHTWRGWSYS
jgi:PPOX class probable F420-dependent enzyme